MVTETTFYPSIRKIGEVKTIATIEEIEAEQMLFNCDWHTAEKLGGPLTRQILAALIDDATGFHFEMRAKGLHPIIDTKSVMLMPGFYPCIGGWHCDAVPRSEYDSQPNLLSMDEEVMNYFAIIPSTKNISNTELVTNKLTLPIDTTSVWSSASKAVDVLAELGSVDINTAEDGCVYRFNQPTIHRGMPAKARGWRYFFRLCYTAVPAANKLRHQVQVYTSPETSW